MRKIKVMILPFEDVEAMKYRFHVIVEEFKETHHLFLNKIISGEELVKIMEELALQSNRKNFKIKVEVDCFGDSKLSFHCEYLLIKFYFDYKENFEFEDMHWKKVCRSNGGNN